MNLASCKMAPVYISRFFSCLPWPEILCSGSARMYLEDPNSLFSLPLQIVLTHPLAPDFSISLPLCLANSSSSSKPQLRFHFLQEAFFGIFWLELRYQDCCYPFTNPPVMAYSIQYSKCLNDSLISPARVLEFPWVITSFLPLIFLSFLFFIKHLRLFL